MVELKTQPTKESVTKFIDSNANEERRKDCHLLVKFMKSATGEEPVMWGKNIVGFGRYTYAYASGREAEWMIIGFSPRKTDLSIYIMPGFDKFKTVMSRLGTYKTGKSCLYIKRLADVDTDALQELIEQSVKTMSDRRVH
jgi:hypothetical protein